MVETARLFSYEGHALHYENLALDGAAFYVPSIICSAALMLSVR